MITKTNRFGTGTMYEASDLKGNVYVECTACMSIWSDFLSYLNNHNCSITTCDNYVNAQTIIVLGCQVTDLAILNDLRKAHALHIKTGRDILMGGCLSQRFDIELPEYIKRLDVVRTEYETIIEKDLITYAKPFWVKELDDSNEFAPGSLFRNMYPLKIGAGCHGKCKYCTIRDTRGNSYETESFLQEDEFIKNENVVLISDSPSIKQIKEWCEIATKNNKEISFRNVEPQIAIKCKEELEKLAKAGLLNIFHCPIQSNNTDVLKVMNRDINSTMSYIEFAQILRAYGTKVATNIIIDYFVGDTLYPNPTDDWMNDNFDYWVWNPYFDGKWDYDKACERFTKYLGN